MNRVGNRTVFNPASRFAAANELAGCFASVRWQCRRFEPPLHLIEAPRAKHIRGPRRRPGFFVRRPKSVSHPHVFKEGQKMPWYPPMMLFSPQPTELRDE
jgi:hypothetical protein